MRLEDMFGDIIVTIAAIPLLDHRDPDYREEANVGVYGLSGYQIERGTSRPDLGIKLSQGIPRSVTLLILRATKAGRATRYIEAIGRVILRVIDEGYATYRRDDIDYDLTHKEAEEALKDRAKLEGLAKRVSIDENGLRCYIESVQNSDAWTYHQGRGDDYIIIFDLLRRFNHREAPLLDAPPPPRGKDEIKFKAGYYRPIRLFTKNEILSLILKGSENV